MKTTCALAALGVVSGFTSPFMGAQVSQKVAKSSALTMSVQNMIGADVETKGLWDPLKLSKDEGALFRRRVVELKHGRIAMLATTGYIVQEFYHPLYDGKVPNGWAAVSQIPEAGWLQIIAAIGVIELTIGKQDFVNKAPGQLGNFGSAFNPFPDDAEKFKALQLKELKNGRLAMVGIMGMMVGNALTGLTPLQQWGTNSL